MATEKMVKNVVVISGGGTGGHVYPGIAIARALVEKHPGWEVHFVGSKIGLENKIVPREGFPLHRVSVGRLHSSVPKLERIKSVLLLPVAFLQSLYLYFRLRPRAVLGVGGFASGPFVWVCSLMGVSTSIWEPNAFPGIANRLLSSWVDRCLVVFDKAAKYMKNRNIIKSGVPVRKSLRPQLRCSGSEFRVLIFGGSQGARGINNAVFDALKGDRSWLEGVHVVHQVGKLDFPKFSHLHSEGIKNLEFHEFLYDMDERYAWADLVICRSGASTVAEICSCQKPSLFIPLPTAADDHQRKNAEALVQEQAADMVLQKDFNAEQLVEKISYYRNHRNILKSMSEKLVKFQTPDVTDQIVEILTGEKK